MPNYQQTSRGNRNTARIPVVTSKHITEVISGSNYEESVYDATNILNGIIETYQGEPDRSYVKARPGFKYIEGGVTGVGRGIYYWEAAGKYVMVAGTKVYVDDYATGLITTGGSDTNGNMTGSLQKVHFIDWSPDGTNSYLFIIDTGADSTGPAGYFIEASDLTTLQPMSGNGTTDQLDSYDFTSFPSTTNYTVVEGCVDFDEYMFIAMSDNYIYNSDIGDFLDWSVENRIKVDAREDELVGIFKTNNHIAAISTRSIQFFYDLADGSAAPLAARQDIQYNSGVSHYRYVGSPIWRDGDDIYFISTRDSGNFSLSIIRDLQVTDIKNNTFSSMMSYGREVEDVRPVVAGFSTGGHTYVSITMVPPVGSIDMTVIYDASMDAWYTWSVPAFGHAGFFLVDYSFNDADNPKPPRGIMWGDNTFEVTDNFIPLDDATARSQPNLNVVPEITLGNLEFGTTNTKFMHSLKIVGQAVLETAALINVSWSDDAGETFTTPIALDVLNGSQINRLGSFSRRQFKLAWDSTTDSKLRIEAIEVEYTEGSS